MNFMLQGKISLAYITEPGLTDNLFIGDKKWME